jgi:hypothetical protein
MRTCCPGCVQAFARLGPGVSFGGADEMPSVKSGRYVLIPRGENSLGRQNLTKRALWGPHVAEFLKQLP